VLWRPARLLSKFATRMIATKCFLQYRLGVVIERLGVRLPPSSLIDQSQIV
jgi:hypothetical protein